MKKTYKAPTTTVLKIGTMKLIMASPDAKFGSGKASGGEVLSRENRNWDDDDWDDEGDDW